MMSRAEVRKIREGHARGGGEKRARETEKEQELDKYGFVYISSVFLVHSSKPNLLRWSRWSLELTIQTLLHTYGQFRDYTSSNTSYACFQTVGEQRNWTMENVQKKLLALCDLTNPTQQLLTRKSNCLNIKEQYF